VPQSLGGEPLCSAADLLVHQGGGSREGPSHSREPPSRLQTDERRLVPTNHESLITNHFSLLYLRSYSDIPEHDSDFFLLVRIFYFLQRLLEQIGASAHVPFLPHDIPFTGKSHVVVLVQ
jgi:hypothetical protein